MASKRKCSRNARHQGLATLRSTSTKAYPGSCSHSCQISTKLHSPTPVASFTYSQMPRNPQPQSCSPSTDSAYVSVFLDSNFANATSNSNSANFQHSDPNIKSQNHNRYYVKCGQGQHRQASETSTLSSDTAVNQVPQHYIPSGGTRFCDQDWDDRRRFVDTKLNSNADARKPKALSRESPRMFLMRPRAKISFPRSLHENLHRRRTLSDSNPTINSRQHYPVFDISPLCGQSLQAFQRSRKSSPDESSQLYYLGDGFENHESNEQYPDYAYGSNSQFKSYSYSNVNQYQLQNYSSYQKRPQNGESGANYSGRYPLEPFSLHELDPEVNRTYDILEPNQVLRCDATTRSHGIRLLDKHELGKKRKMGDNHDKQLQNELETNQSMSRPGENEEILIDRQTQSRLSRRTQRYPTKQRSNYGHLEARNTRSADLTTFYQNGGIGVCKNDKSFQEIVSPRKNSKVEKQFFLTEGSNHKGIGTSTPLQCRASNSYRWLPGPGTSCDRFRGGSPHPDIKKGQWDKQLPPKGHNNKNQREHLQKPMSHKRKDWFAAWGLSEHEMMQASMGDNVDDLKTALSRSCPHTFANGCDDYPPWNISSVKVKQSDPEHIFEDVCSKRESQAQDKTHVKIKTAADGRDFINQSGGASSFQKPSKKATESSFTSSFCSNFSVSANDEDKTSVTSEWDSHHNQKFKKQKQGRKKKDGQKEKEKNVNSPNKSEDQSSFHSASKKHSLMENVSLEKSSVPKQVLQKQGGKRDNKKRYRPEEEEPNNEQRSFINLQQHRERQKQWQKKILQRHKQLQKNRERQQRKLEQEQQEAANISQEPQNKDKPHQGETRPRTNYGIAPSIARSSATEMADTKVNKLSTIEESLSSKNVPTQAEQVDKAEQVDSHSEKQNQALQLSNPKKFLKRSLSVPAGSFDSAVLRRIKFSYPRGQKVLKRLKKNGCHLTLQLADKEVGEKKKVRCQRQRAEKNGNVEITRSSGFTKMVETMKSKESLDKVVRRTLSKNIKAQPSTSTKRRQKITVSDWQWRFFVGTSGMTFVMCIAVAYLVTKIVEPNLRLGFTNQN